MTPQERQALLDNPSQEDLQKLEQHRASTEGTSYVDEEALLGAEFAKAYGWDAYQAHKRDQISTREFLTLIEANRMLEAHEQYRTATAVFYGTIPGKTKKPFDTFKKLTEAIIKKSKVKE